MQERAFVLAPLAEIAPGLLLDGTTVAVRAEAIDRFGVRRLERKKFGWPPAPTS
jgi:2-amino-4-hydroxy-6-hydroxymethyldihydropteridine diphosphokinase